MMDAEISQAVAGQLKDVGINVTVDTLEWGVFSEEQYSHEGGRSSAGLHDRARRRTHVVDLALDPSRMTSILTPLSMTVRRRNQ